MVETILQHWIFTSFVFPFLLIFFLVFGILEKSKLFGSGKQLNALISFVIGLIFVAAVFPKLVVTNLILFLTIGVVVLFVTLLLWGFVAGDKGLGWDNISGPMRGFILFIIIVSVLAALIWALGVPGTFFGDIFNFLFQSTWSKDFWVNATFVAVIIIALGLILKAKSE